MRAQPAMQDVPPCVLYFKHPAIKREIQKNPRRTSKTRRCIPKIRRYIPKDYGIILLQTKEFVCQEIRPKNLIYLASPIVFQTAPKLVNFSVYFLYNPLN